MFVSSVHSFEKAQVKHLLVIAGHERRVSMYHHICIPGTSPLGLTSTTMQLYGLVGKFCRLHFHAGVVDHLFLLTCVVLYIWNWI